LWVYDEQSKTVKSYWKLSDKKEFSLDARSGHITAKATDSRWYQMWTISPDGHLFTDKAQGSNDNQYAHV